MALGTKGDLGVCLGETGERENWRARAAARRRVDFFLCVARPRARPLELNATCVPGDGSTAHTRRVRAGFAATRTLAQRQGHPTPAAALSQSLPLRPRTRCMRTYGLGPKQVSQTMGKSDRSQPSASGSRVPDMVGGASSEKWEALQEKRRVK